MVKIIDMRTERGEERRGEADNEGQVGQKPVKQVIQRAETREKGNLRGERESRKERRRRKNPRENLAEKNRG